jgi:hypothetical protein
MTGRITYFVSMLFVMLAFQNCARLGTGSDNSETKMQIPVQTSPTWNELSYSSSGGFPPPVGSPYGLRVNIKLDVDNQSFSYTVYRSYVGDLQMHQICAWHEASPDQYAVLLRNVAMMTPGVSLAGITDAGVHQVIFRSADKSADTTYLLSSSDDTYGKTVLFNSADFELQMRSLADKPCVNFSP